MDETIQAAEQRQCEEALSHLPADTIQKFDNLFRAKLQSPLLTLQDEIATQYTFAIRLEELDNEDVGRWLKYFVRRIDEHDVSFRTFLTAVDAISRDVWHLSLTQEITPEFVRGVLYPTCAGYIAIHEENIEKVLRGEAPPFAASELQLAIQHLRGRCVQLGQKIRNQYYEIESVELEYKQGYNRSLHQTATRTIQAPDKPIARVIPAAWTDLSQKGSLKQSEAAEYLDCKARAVRYLLEKGELKKTRNGRIVCDEHLRNQIRKRRGDHVLR